MGRRPVDDQLKQQLATVVQAALASDFLVLSASSGRSQQQLSSAAVEKLSRHGWPAMCGNFAT
jgi:hypothetical protein